MMPTPRTCSAIGASLNTKGNLQGNRNPNLETVVGRMLLPTPCASEGEKYTNTYNPDSQMGQSLSAMAGSRLLPTPQTSDCQEPLSPEQKEKYVEKWKARGIRPSAAYQLRQQAVEGLLPTPIAGDWNGQVKGEGKGPETMLCGVVESAAKRLLPTPTARDDKNPSSPDGERIARKQRQGWTIELSDLAAMKVLPTPTTRDYQPPVNPEFMTRRNGMTRDDQLACIPTMLGLKKRGGITFRLSPLFTQEMMGFPFGWTELPFLPQCNPRITEIPTASASTSDDGEQNRSKPTETP